MMSDTCLAQADAILEVAGNTYRRPLTPVELEYGDVAGMRAGFDAAETRVVTLAAPVVARIVAQLADEVRPLLASGDIAGIARVKASHTAELAAAITKASTLAIAAGKRQVLDSAKAHGVKLAKLPARKDVKRAADYVTAKAAAISEQVAQQIEANVRRSALAAAAKGVEDIASSDLVDWEDASARSLVGSAIEMGRTAYDAGRLFGYDEVRDDVSEVVYTAILDDNVCEVCAGADGESYTGDAVDDGFAAAPNDDCEGGERCRCYPVLVYSR